ncbi:jg26749 [Pararge aegeria aegeria]|uniref:Jg26749 protein n=1 Tax=Pararge aegeria aegeria TaxID=348720 RepID=A0A8S4S8U5_9NEOP|nr:jg26749 [Pararge aegeria aegeria]
MPQIKMHKFSHLKYLPLMLFQLLLMVLFFIFVRYDGDKHHDLRGFEGTHVMIFVGFGFLMTFLKKYSYSALGFNWFLAAIVIQWAFLCQNFYHLKDNKILATKETLLADVGGSIAIHTFGAYFGLGTSWAMKPHHKKTSTAPTATSAAVDLNGPTYISDVTAMIGLFAKLSFLSPLKDNEHYDDDVNWELP